MRVLVVSAWDPRRPTDGSSLVLLHHLRHLADRHDLTVLTPDTNPPAEGVEVPVPVIRVPAPTGPVDGLRRRAQVLRTGEPSHVPWVARPDLLARLEAARQDPPDLLYLFGWGTAPLHRHLPGVPAVHHAVDPWSVNHRNRHAGLRGLLDAPQALAIRRHERRHLPAMAAVVVVAPHDAAALRHAVPGATVAVVGNGVEAGPAPQDRRRGPPTLALHGAFEARANQVAAVTLVTQVLPEVRRQVPDVRLLLIGRDPPPSVQRLAADGVEVTGAVPDVRPWLEQADVYVAPMTAGTGLKNKVLEAMAAGLPVVATPAALSGIGEGHGVRAAPVSRMAAAVLDVLADPDGRAAAGAQARRRVVDAFGWDASATALEDLWRRACR